MMRNWKVWREISSLVTSRFMAVFIRGSSNVFVKYRASAKKYRPLILLIESYKASTVIKFQLPIMEREYCQLL